MLAPSSSDACHDSTLSFTTLTCHDVTAEVDVANQAAGPCCVNRKRLQGSNAISESLESDSPKQMPRAMTALQSLQRLEMNPSRLMPLAGEVVHSCPHDAGGSNFDRLARQEVRLPGIKIFEQGRGMLHYWSC